MTSNISDDKLLQDRRDQILTNSDARPQESAWNSSSVKPDGSSRVSFKDSVEVVLAPTREEFKKANCDLWWSRNDYLTFQNTSHYEIRLYALFHSLPLREARRKLYQDREDPGLECAFMSLIKVAHSKEFDSDEAADQHFPFPARQEESLSCDSLTLYVPSPMHEELKSDEHTRMDYHRKYNTLVSELYWNSTGGMLAVIGMASVAVPVVGLYFMHMYR